MVILISRVADGYFVDAVVPPARLHVLTPSPVPADEAFRLACEAGAQEDQVLEALDDADVRWRRVMRSFGCGEVPGDAACITLPGPPGGGG